MSETETIYAQLLETIRSKKAELDTRRPFPAEPLARLEAWYDVELTYTSNAIEGNTLTRSETAIVLEKGLTVHGKPLKDHQEAVDHLAALHFVRELAKENRTIKEIDVRDIHRLIVSSTLRDEAGAYSKFERRILGSEVELPGPVAVPMLMEEFGRWLSESKPSPETAFEAHLRLVSIHPFSDGNGRTSRLLMNLLLIKAGYPPPIIRPEDRSEYFETLEKNHLQSDTSNYKIFVAQRLDTALDDFLKFLTPAPEVDPEKKPHGPSDP